MASAAFPVIFNAVTLRDFRAEAVLHDSDVIDAQALLKKINESYDSASIDLKNILQPEEEYLSNSFNFEIRSKADRTDMFMRRNLVQSNLGRIVREHIPDFEGYDFSSVSRKGLTQVEDSVLVNRWLLHDLYPELIKVPKKIPSLNRWWTIR